MCRSARSKIPLRVIGLGSAIREETPLTFTPVIDGEQRYYRFEAKVRPILMYYNFGRVHQTLRVTPAMEAGISDHVWSIEEIVRLLGA